MYISKSTACQDSLPFRLRKNGGVEVITAANSVRVDPTDPDARQTERSMKLGTHVILI